MQRSHFALWALAKAPLLIGTDLRKISQLSLDILKAPEVRKEGGGFLGGMWGGACEGGGKGTGS